MRHFICGRVSLQERTQKLACDDRVSDTKAPAIMKIARILLVSFLALLGSSGLVCAQEAEAATPVPADEIRALRELLEKQGQQIEGLRSAVDDLSKTIRQKEASPAAPVSATPSTPPAPSSTPAAPPTPPKSTPPPAASAEIPKAEAVPAGPQHTVAKGETLTSIAKHYNITSTDLQKANKVVDDRKLQIGQVLTIPASKTAETPTEKKETP
jgi:LysM repeat protein